MRAFIKEIRIKHLNQNGLAASVSADLLSTMISMWNDEVFPVKQEFFLKKIAMLEKRLKFSLSDYLNFGDSSNSEIRYT